MTSKDIKTAYILTTLTLVLANNAFSSACYQYICAINKFDRYLYIDISVLDTCYIWNVGSRVTWPGGCSADHALHSRRQHDLIDRRGVASLVSTKQLIPLHTNHE